MFAGRVGSKINTHFLTDFFFTPTLLLLDSVYGMLGFIYMHVTREEF